MPAKYLAKEIAWQVSIDDLEMSRSFVGCQVLLTKAVEVLLI